MNTAGAHSALSWFVIATVNVADLPATTDAVPGPTATVGFAVLHEPPTTVGTLVAVPVNWGFAEFVAVTVNSNAPDVVPPCCVTITISVAPGLMIADGVDNEPVIAAGCTVAKLNIDAAQADESLLVIVTRYLASPFGSTVAGRPILTVGLAGTQSDPTVTLAVAVAV